MKSIVQTVLILVICFGAVQAQSNKQSLNLDKLSKVKLLRMLHSYSNDEEPNWIIKHSDSLHLEKDTLEMSNSKLESKKCFTSSWYFLNSFSYMVQFAKNSYLCQEPPRCSAYSLCDFKISKIENDIYIQFRDYDGDLIFNFKIVSLEMMQSKKVKSYWMKLIPIN